MAITVWLADLGAPRRGLPAVPVGVRAAVSEELLRHAAAVELGVSASKLRTERRRDAAPRVYSDGGGEAHASLSHSGRWVAAVVLGQPVGLDIEAPTRRRDVLRMSEWFFSQEEHGWIEQQLDVEEGFYRMWTGKEAVLKLESALGRNIALGAVRFRPSGQDLLPPFGAALSFAQLYSFDAALRCTLALSDTGQSPVVRFERADPEHLPSLRLNG